LNPPQAGYHRLAVLAIGAADERSAAELSQRMNLPLLAVDTRLEDCAAWPAALVVQDGRLFLQRTGKGVPGPVAVEFGSAAMRHRRRSGHNEMLGRAVGVGKKTGLRVLDATAGLGRDGFVLADLGCEVTLCERSVVVSELLSWGLAAAGPAAACRRAGDARELPESVLAEVDVIYLDPMFPQRGKSAAVKKEMALFQWLLEQDEGDDEDELWRWAMAANVARVVVKRPPRAPCLAGSTPSHTISGKSVRYDVYVQRGLA
jgi:16S rRNA (guanine1516-N2)-methyltransferase